jgi:nucleotide-binding universal stress UspA family protein
LSRTLAEQAKGSGPDLDIHELLREVFVMPVAEPTVQIAFKRILVATDFSECSERAMLTGVGIAQQYGSKLHVIHVVPSEGYGVAGAGMLGAVNFAWHSARNLESELLRKGFLKGIQYQISVQKGEVWPAVSQIVQDERIDLVVVGTHGRSGLGKLLLGSVAEKIFRQARCPVLTVGPNFQPVFPLIAQSRGVFFPTDFSPQSENAFPYAVSLAREHQTQLVVLHVVQPTGSEASYKENRVLRYRCERLQELMAPATGLAREPEFIVEMGEPAETIVKVAAERGAELIVLGVRPPARLADRLGWSTASGVVRQAHCPILTVRNMELV